MTVFSLVASHHDLSLDAVARLSAGASGVGSALPSEAAGAVVLATCNRVEIYAEAAEGQVAQARQALTAAVAAAAGLPGAEVADAFRILDAETTARHLFEVGAGLDSAVVGEREIAGQVRRALVEARERGTATGALVRLFESASRTAKDVGARTALGATGRSVVSVALDLAEELRGLVTTAERRRFWAGASVLLIGTGSYAGTTLAQLSDRGAGTVGVHSASGRAARFVADRGGWALPLDGTDVEGAVAEADVIIGCSGGERQVGPQALAVLRSGTDRPVTLVDLALSRDFDPAVADVPGVDLLTLESVRLAAPDQARAAVVEARRLVDAAVADYAEAQRGRSADEAVKALRRHTLRTLDREMERVRARHGCTAAADEVQFALRRMVNQFLHAPSVRARELAAEGRLEEYERALEVLFDITVPQTAPAPASACPVRPDEDDAPTSRTA
ncbi:glutamyl-tRNA reductase [Micrococcus sp.]|uniref:glutamyl-tRNA reductase n=1 Tax=Micrococcus sp. TaxID=1271 RepID=UPI002A90901A|nr:glutamyl-tRNA reductase [Micrococcus sp.]MDY6054567.1 glutamyl-tRNA reductase [Micrococcus sp.]